MDELIGEHTVNTLPEGTWNAFKDHGVVARTVDRHLDEEHRLLRELGHLDIDVERLGAQLQRDGVSAFARSFDNVVAMVDRRREELLQSREA